MYLIKNNKEGEAMRNHSIFLKENEYFKYFESMYNDLLFYEKYPLISERIKELCEKIREKTHTKQIEDFFKLHAEILGLDAQLQIILLLLNLKDENSDLSEEVILKYAEKDYKTFMQDLCEDDYKEIINHSLYFSVI